MSANSKSEVAPQSAVPQYAVVIVQKISRSLEDEVTALLFAAGAEGVSEDLPFVQLDLRYDPEIIMTAEVTLKAYFTKLPTETERLAVESEIRELEPSILFSMSLENHKDWLEEWKKGFVPFLFADPFWVVPKWCPIPAEVAATPKYALLIDPGMAFGTGTHETTKLAASLIVEWMTNNSAEPSVREGSELRARDGGARVLDVGTGTGVLALITERMGAFGAVGLDIDPEARRTARENLELNKSISTKIDDRDLSDIARECEAKGETYDLVIANIIDGVLLVLADDLRKTMKPHGTLVLSGILTDREDEFHREFAKKTGLAEQRRIRMGEWCASLWLNESVTAGASAAGTN
ncbi:50S ribosomal protein L11 methyltransferase [soil metagenome]